MQTIDWRKILIAYIQHVNEREGWHFLGGVSDGWPVNLNEDERAALEQARDEAEAEN